MEKSQNGLFFLLYVELELIDTFYFHEKNLQKFLVNMDKSQNGLFFLLYVELELIDTFYFHEKKSPVIFGSTWKNLEMDYSTSHK